MLQSPAPQNCKQRISSPKKYQNHITLPCIYPTCILELAYEQPAAYRAVASEKKGHADTLGHAKRMFFKEEIPKQLLIWVIGYSFAVCKWLFHCYST